ncbi:MAG: Flp family type IVb pilin, partial [Chloroflexota bacterium]
RSEARGRPDMAWINGAVRRWALDEHGQGLAEYALILALIAIVAIVALIFLGSQISDIINHVGESI